MRHAAPFTFDIWADYGQGYVRVARHTNIHSATAQAEHRFICSSAISVQVRRSDSPTRVITDSSGKVVEWRL